MYLWQRLASPSWWNANEEVLRDLAGNKVAVIERPGRKRITVEIAFPRRNQASDLQRRFGGHFNKLPGAWLKRFCREQKTAPLRIGKRLVITNVGATSASQSRSHGLPSGRSGPSHIAVPAGAAFGTGQHATTAMSLRLLEQLTRHWKPGWSLADLGTGSGIFALAAKRLGAGVIVAIDNDPVAISTAKGNARLNKITGIHFAVADVRRWRLPSRADVVTANLFSELLIDVMPGLKRVPWLILSGIMRDQEDAVLKALKPNDFKIIETRRRGKWVAMLVTGLDHTD
ncbi:MAG TPA: 50S ribosomal protein L11 methyltransferase [Chthoniobacterales bacterium]|nr:50S ribosomal protein L11 methyltransferase [Chthoniobacterales bacterium]